MEKQAQMTFFPPVEVRSGLTESPFSLLEDLDLLLFSFSAEGGEPQGLSHWLFFAESEERTFDRQ